MLAPSIFGENLFDDFFGGFPFYDGLHGQRSRGENYPCF